MRLSYEVTSASRAKDDYPTSVSPEAHDSRRDHYPGAHESPGKSAVQLAPFPGPRRTPE